MQEEGFGGQETLLQGEAVLIEVQGMSGAIHVGQERKLREG